MAQKRVLAIHDISCFGKCSLTVALPIISATGVECTVMPTAVLSTHTGGFKGYTYRDLTDDLLPITEHWKTLGLGFDAIYTGFLGSFEQIDIVSKIFDELKGKDTLIIVDPVMADNGELYPIFDKDFPKGMIKLCAKADVIVPNITEAVMLLGEEYVKGPYSKEYIEGLLKRLGGIGSKKIVLTGVFFDDRHLGAAAYDTRTGTVSYAFHELIPGYYHGTGDVFGSVVVSALMNGSGLRRANELAVEFTAKSIMRTRDAGTDIRFGVNFEEGLGTLAKKIREAQTMRFCGTDDAKELAAMANDIWTEYYSTFFDTELPRYFLGRFQSEEAIRQQIKDGYLYSFIKDGGEKAGYFAILPKGDSLFLSKLYISKDFRGKGLGSRTLDEVLERGRAMKMRRVYLRVNKDNTPSRDIYLHKGFVIAEDIVEPIEDGFVLDDYLMEYVF